MTDPTDPLPPEVRAALEATPPPAESPPFPTLMLDGIGKAMVTMYEAMDVDMLAAFKAWGDLKGLKERCARIEVRDPNAPNGSDVSDMFTVHGARLAFGGTIIIADTAQYGRAPAGPVDATRHERTFVGKTYTVALLHRDEAAKIPVLESEAPVPEPETDMGAIAESEDDVDPDVELPAGADEFQRLCTRLYTELGEENGGPLHVQLEDGNTNWLIGDLADREISEFEGALALINAGKVPSSAVEGDEVATTAYHYCSAYYGDRREVLRCAVDILNVSRGWTQAQVDAVYWPWSRTIYGKGAR